MGQPTVRGNSSYRTLRDRSLFAELPGTSYLATCILSLQRDKILVAMRFRSVTRTRSVESVIRGQPRVIVAHHLISPFQYVTSWRLAGTA